MNNLQWPFLKLIHQAKRKFIPYNSSPVPFLIVHKVRNKAEKKEETGFRQSNIKDLALFLTTTGSEGKHIMATGQAVLKAMWEISVLVPTNGSGSIEAIPHNNTTKKHAFMAPSRTMHFYTEFLLHITIFNFGKVDAHLPEQQQVCKVASAPVKMVHITHESYSCYAGA